MNIDTPINVLLGVDVGSTRVKVHAFDLKGNDLAHSIGSYRLIRPQTDWVEQDAMEIQQALYAAIRETTQALDGEKHHIIGLSLSTQAGTTVPVDRSLSPLGNAISWMDRRGLEVLPWLNQKFDPERLFHDSGWRLRGLAPIGHIAWMREFEPERYHAARYFLQLNDFLIYQLTGELCQDPSNAGISVLYHIYNHDWNPDVLQALGIPSTHLSPVRPSGERIAYIKPEICQQLGLSSRTWLVNGCHDQYAAAFGAGVTQPGQVLLSCGTSWIVMVVTETPYYGDASAPMAVSQHAVPHRWGALRSMRDMGYNIEWLVDQVLAPLQGYAGDERMQTFETLNNLVQSAPAGSDGLLYFPLAGGHNALNRKGGGALWGLSPRHTRATIARAVQEGVAFELRSDLDPISSSGIPIHILVMVGGATRSTTWPQIVADISGIPVRVPIFSEAAAVGAARLAGIGCDCFTWDDPFPQLEQVYREVLPAPQEAEMYRKIYPYYQSSLEAFEQAPRPVQPDK